MISSRQRCQTSGRFRLESARARETAVALPPRADDCASRTEGDGRHADTPVNDTDEAVPIRNRLHHRSRRCCCAAAAVAAQDADLAGGKDHPAISRYAGSVIIGYNFRKFDELLLPLSRVEIVIPPGAAVAKKDQKVEGQVTQYLMSRRRNDRRSRCCGTTSRS